MRALGAALEQIRAAGRYRTRRLLDGAQGAEVTVDGRRCVAFTSNDYLGLAGAPELAEALREGAERYGVGAGASQLISGHSRAHRELEEALARFTHRPRALLFSTGYMANLGTVSALLGRHDVVIEDRLNHASLIDAALLSRARLLRYRHADCAELARRLDGVGDAKTLVATDGVFSMEGDVAPIAELAGLCRAKKAWLMVDDAHGLGVLGAHGGGVLEHLDQGLEQVPVLVGTLGKALGTFGAFVAGDEDLIDYVMQRARTYIYTTAPPPALAHATLTSLRLVREQSWRRERLGALIRRFRHNARDLDLPIAESATPIQPLIVGTTQKALRISAALFERGLLVTAIRPPTVTAGTERLRITFSALHTEEHVDRLAEALAEVI